MVHAACETHLDVELKVHFNKHLYCLPWFWWDYAVTLEHVCWLGKMEGEMCLCLCVAERGC